MEPAPFSPRGLEMRVADSVPPEVARSVAKIESDTLEVWQETWRSEGQSPPSTIAGAVPAVGVVELDAQRELWIHAFRSPWSRTTNTFVVRDVEQQRAGAPRVFSDCPYPFLDVAQGRLTAFPILSSWGHPVESADVDGDGSPELGLSEWEHNGTMSNTVFTWFHRIDEDLSLQPVVRLPRWMDDVPTGGDVVTDIEVARDLIHILYRRQHADPALNVELAWQRLHRPNPQAPFELEAFAVTDTTYDYTPFVDRTP